MAAVFWDTNVFIYLIEGRPREFADLAARVRGDLARRGDQLVTSTLTLGEVLVQPLRSGRTDLAARYRELLQQGAAIVPLDEPAADRYAAIRAEFPAVRPPDAVQLACAAQHGVATFITNDDRLGKVTVRGIQEIAPLRDWAA
jgi:predicted nucleic acid-binding protein